MLQLQRPYLDEVDFEDDAPSSIGDDSIPETDVHETSPSLDNTPGPQISRTDTIYFDASKPPLLPVPLTESAIHHQEGPTCPQSAGSDMPQ